MNKKTITIFMYLLMTIGSILVLTGIGLIVFTDIYLSKGANGVMTIAVLIAGGLFLLLPSKIYLTLVLMQRNDEKQRASRLDAKSIEPKFLS